MVLLEEAGFHLLLYDSDSEVKYIGFLTTFFSRLKSNGEIIFDATCKSNPNKIVIWFLLSQKLTNLFCIDKTNALGFELYAIIGQINGTGFPMVYLFLDNVKKDDGIRTTILLEFFKQLQNRGLQNPEFFLTDKDWAQINAALSAWPNIKIQLCLWHLKRAVKKRLADSSIPKRSIYDSEFARTQTAFVDATFHPFPRDNVTGIRSTSSVNQRFCPKKLREKFWNNSISFSPSSINTHWHEPVLSSHDIWLLSVREMHEFCVDHNLKNVWAYLWTNWYQNNTWMLWARAANSEKLFKTTMLIEAHWKIIKRDFLSKFFRPRLDLVIFVIVNRLLPHHQRQYNQLISGREIASWRKDMKRE